MAEKKTTMKDAQVAALDESPAAEWANIQKKSPLVKAGLIAGFKKKYPSFDTKGYTVNTKVVVPLKMGSEYAGKSGSEHRRRPVVKE